MVQDLTYDPLIIEQQVLPDHISFSALRTYLECPLRYYFSYIAGLPAAAVSSSLVLGSAFHSAYAELKVMLSRTTRTGQEVPSACLYST